MNFINSIKLRSFVLCAFSAYKGGEEELATLPKCLSL